jgi:hypothetical protein
VTLQTGRRRRCGPAYRADTEAGPHQIQRETPLFANLAHRSVATPSGNRTVGPEDPLSIGGVYEQLRAA